MGGQNAVTSHDKTMVGSDNGPVWTDARREAFGNLSAAMLGGRPVVALVGPEGIGKVTLAREWAAQCGPDMRVLEFGPVTGAMDSDLAQLAARLAPNAQPTDQAAVLPALREALEAHARVGARTALIVEDADRLPDNLRKMITMLTGIDVDGRPVLQVVLCGEGGLVDLLDKGGPRRAEVIELPALTRTATGVLFKRSLSAPSTVSEEMGDAIHDLTGGVPAQVLAFAAEVDTRVAKGDALDMEMIAGIVEAATGDAAAETGAADEDADALVDPGQLPGSIRETEDPRRMLRWAFGLQEDEDEATQDLETGALSLPEARSRPSGDAPASAEELNRALAEIAERESKARDAGELDDPADMPELPFGKGVDASQFRHGADGLAAIMAHDRRLNPVPRPRDPDTEVADPDALRAILLEEQAPPKRGFGRPLLLAGGLAACFAAGAYLWPELQVRLSPAAQVGADGAPTETDRKVAVLLAGPEGVFSDDVAAPVAPEADMLWSELSAVPASADEPVLAGAAQAMRDANTAQIDEHALTISVLNAEGQRARIAAQVSAAEDRLASVEAQVAAAEARLATLTGQASLMISDIDTLGNERTSLLAEVESQREAARAAASELAETEARLEGLRSELAAAAQNRADLEARVADLVSARDAAVSEQATLQSLIDSQKSSVEDVDAAVSTARQELAALDADLEAARRALADVTAERAEAAASLEAATAEGDALRAEAVQLRAAAESARAEMAEVTAALENRQAQLLLEEEALQAVQAQQEAVGAELSALQAQAAEARARAEAENAALVAQRDELAADVAEKEAARQALATDLEALAGQRAELEAARADLTRIEAQIADARITASDAQAVADAAVADLSAEREALSAQVALDRAALTTLRSDIERLTAERDALQEDLVAVSAAQEEAAAQAALALKDRDAAQADMATVSGALDSARADLEAMGAERADVAARLDALKADADALARSVATLRAEEDALAQALVDGKKALGQARADAAAAMSTVSAADRALSTKLAELAATELKLEQARAAIGQIETARTAISETGSLAPRDAAIVDAGLERAPGLDALSQQQAEVLRTALIEGHCVPDALRASTGRANPFTVRALRRSVGDCIK